MKITLRVILCVSLIAFFKRTYIFLTNFMLYLPAIGFVFAAITGICPSQQAILKMFK